MTNMQKVINILSMTTAMLLLFISATAQTTTWKVDHSHSSLGFSVDHLVISETTGEFQDYTMDIKADKDNFTDANFSVIIETKSIDTDDQKRDEHLRSEDFFNAEKYPTITFKGEKFEKINANLYKVTGELTMHGVTQKVTFDAQFGGIVNDPWGGIRAGLKLWGTVDRYDYDLKYNSVLEAGGLAIGREIRIECRLELIKA